jgi:hypothetical protein
MNFTRKIGDTRVLLITYTPIYDEGRVTSVLSIARDITEERLARGERAAQADKLRALGQLASRGSTQLQQHPRSDTGSCPTDQARFER